MLTNAEESEVLTRNSVDTKSHLGIVDVVMFLTAAEMTQQGYALCGSSRQRSDSFAEADRPESRKPATKFAHIQGELGNQRLSW